MCSMVTCHAFACTCFLATESQIIIYNSNYYIGLSAFIKNLETNFNYRSPKRNPHLPILYHTVMVQRFGHEEPCFSSWSLKVFSTYKFPVIWCVD